ncbi:MAG: cation diffusion facilitator family transporter [Proteobacteria bacterium]|nr:cation diffusion facilitator family transporter [Pseudomonadota bacterium]
MAGSSKKAIYAALVGNSLIAVTKFTAATFTGSSAMFSEGVHSLVDTGNQILLLYGLKRAETPPSSEFPFGHGKEVYFWCFVVAMLIFGIGASVSLYQGWQHLFHAEPLHNLSINYIVLGFAVLFESGALWVAMREFNAQKGHYGFLEAVRMSKDPSIFVVVFEDTAALLGLLVALAGLVAYQITGNLIFDALASIIIGLILAGTALWLAYESKSLLIGEAASPLLRTQIRDCVVTDPRITHVNEVATMHMGPQQIIVNLSVDFVDGVDSSVVKQAVTDATRRIKALDPAISRVFIEVERNSDHLVNEQHQPTDRAGS